MCAFETSPSHALFHAEKEAAEGFAVERDERIEIRPRAVDRLVGGNQHHDERKPDAEASGMAYKPLAQLLTESEVVFTCLNKNVLLLGKDEFAQLGEGKVLFNTSIGPGFDSCLLYTSPSPRDS